MLHFIQRVITAYRTAKLMADIEDLKTRAAALAPRVQAALTAANLAGQNTGATQALAQYGDDLTSIDNSLAAVEAIAPPVAS